MVVLLIAALELEVVNVNKKNQMVMILLLHSIILTLRMRGLILLLKKWKT